MREPLDSFADRLIRNREVIDFIRGLVREKGVPMSDVIEALDDRGGTPVRVGGFLESLPGADPHDPDGGHGV